MLAFQWSSFPKMNSSFQGGLDARDEACLKEVAEVLKRHGREYRFGVNLLHSHFEIAPDEVLLETNDPSDHSLWIRPVKKSQLSGEAIIETAWCLATGHAQMSCVCKKYGSEHSHTHKR